MTYKVTGSGDRAFDWTFAFCVFAAALLATAVWTILDRKRMNYIALNKWFRLFIRFSLGAVLVSYGLVKLVPLQMPYPFLTRLVEPYGDFSPMGALWYSIGASPAYEMFAGSAETLAGFLLFFPRTAMLGALIGLADAVNIFALNMNYDVPVKLFSFHLILLCLLLLAPDFPRLARSLFSREAVGPTRDPDSFQKPCANRVAFWFEAAFGMALILANTYHAQTRWYRSGGGAAKSPLYGIWNVDRSVIDGKLHEPLLSDRERWKRVIFDQPARMTLQRMDDTFVNYDVKIDTSSGSVLFTRRDDKDASSGLKFEQAAPGQMTLQGKLDGHEFSAQLRLLDRDSFLLVNRRFHWIQEVPFNR